VRQALPHQADFIVAEARAKAVALFWQMRLGKTLAAIRWLSRFNPERTLIVAPLSVLETWEAELELEGVPFRLLLGSQEQRLDLAGDCPAHEWCLVNYEGLVAVRTKKNPGKEFGARPTPIALLPWDAVVLDESTRIRKSQANITKVANKHLATAPIRALLSGLPNPEGPEDYCEQLLFLYGEFLGCDNFWRFRDKHFKQIGYDWFPRPHAFAKIKTEVHKRCNILTRKQVGMFQEKVREKRYVSLPQKQRAAYDEAEQNFVLAGKETKSILAVRVWLQRMCGGQLPEDPEFSSPHKLAEIASLVDGELRREKLLVFFRFNAELLACEKLLRKKKRSVITILGANGRKENSQRRLAFQKDQFQIALCQTRCVRYGLDFSRSSTVIYFSNWEDYEIRGQSEDRVLHPAKKEANLYIDLLVRNSIDEDILFALQHKGATAKSFNSTLVERMKSRWKKNSNRSSR